MNVAERTPFGSEIADCLTSENSDDLARHPLWPCVEATKSGHMLYDASHVFIFSERQSNMV